MYHEATITPSLIFTLTCQITVRLLCYFSACKRVCPWTKCNYTGCLAVYQSL